ncbi:MAG TPA: DEAD/DEAH box helicase [Trueperaceae bacterium]
MSEEVALASGPADILRLVAPSGAEVVGRQVLPASEGEFASLPEHMPPPLATALHEAGITRLYRHQREAIDAVEAGENVLLTTGTASGKSLAYQLPALAKQLNDPAATVLMLYPTKALAHDQGRSFSELAVGAGLSGDTVASYDGDTPSGRRPQIRSTVRSLITNPDMLHAGILPHHTLWRRFLEGLSLVVVDEIHSYRGVFGGHIAGVLRRLMRVVRHYGARPSFVLTSATLGNPLDHALNLSGTPVRHIAADTAPHGERELLLVQPPLVNAELGLRRPALQEAVSIAQRLVNSGKQVLVFCGSRQGAEEAVLGLRQRVAGVRSYRSGLLPKERRAIEEELRSGEARAVVSTNALELGVDVGSVDAVVVAGYPGSAAAFRQQVGRAGRRGRPGTGILVLGGGPLDQYLARHPEHLFGASSERALIDPDHLLIALDHLRCAAFELAVSDEESFGGYEPEAVWLLMRQLQEEGEAHLAGGRAYWLGQTYPAQEVGLRSAANDQVTLVSGEKTIGIVDAASSRWMVHQDAVYLHDGEPYLVEELDLERRIARLQPTGDRYLTRATRETRIDPAGELQQEPVTGASKFMGEVVVTDKVVGYRRIVRQTFETLGRYPLDLEPTTLHTVAYGFSPTEETVEMLRRQGSWSNDANDYGRSWPAIRSAAKRRDGFRCQVCGTAEGNGSVLHVHHKIPFRAFASAEQANRLDNLATLCPGCHRQAEQGVRVRSGLAATAYALRSLAPLLVMCDAQDLGVHSEPASSLAAGAPALVIYETVPGGVGLAQELAQRHEELVGAARDLVAHCSCEDGCPACVGPAGELGHAGKGEAAALLGALT